MQLSGADVNSPYKGKCWTNLGDPLINSLLWGVYSLLLQFLPILPCRQPAYCVLFDVTVYVGSSGFFYIKVSCVKRIIMVSVSQYYQHICATCLLCARKIMKCRPEEVSFPHRQLIYCMTTTILKSSIRCLFKRLNKFGLCILSLICCISKIASTIRYKPGYIAGPFQRRSYRNPIDGQFNSQLETFIAGISEIFSDSLVFQPSFFSLPQNRNSVKPLPPII